MNYKLSQLLDKTPIPGAIKRIVRAFSKHMNAYDDSPEAWVNQDTIAEEEGISRSTVCRNTKKAVEMGFLLVKKQFHRNGRQKCSVYQLNLLSLYELAGQKQYSDQLPVTESEVTELPEIEDILSYIEIQDPEEREKLVANHESTNNLINNVPIFAKCYPSKEKRLYIKNISPSRSFITQERTLERITERPKEEQIRTSDPKLISHYLQQMRESIFRRH